MSDFNWTIMVQKDYNNFSFLNSLKINSLKTKLLVQVLILLISINSKAKYVFLVLVI